MTEILLSALQVSVVLLILGIGMSSRVADVGHLWHRKALLVRSVVAMYVLVPLAAFVIVRTFPITPPVKAVLLVFAASAGAPLLPKRLLSLGSGAYVFSLVVSSSLLAIVVVPAWVWLLGRHFEAAEAVSFVNVALLVAKAFLLPLAIGMAVSAAAPAWSQRHAGKVLSVAGLLLASSGVVVLAVNWEIFLSVRPIGVAALLTLMVVSLAIGHLLGGPLPDDRTALAIACCTRHIGLAVLVASSFPGSNTLLILGVYLVASLLVTIPYLRWRKRATPAGAPAAGSG
jgi:predicted Na+-dependent transporter